MLRQGQFDTRDGRFGKARLREHLAEYQHADGGGLVADALAGKIAQLPKLWPRQQYVCPARTVEDQHRHQRRAGGARREHFVERQHAGIDGAGTQRGQGVRRSLPVPQRDGLGQNATILRQAKRFVPHPGMGRDAQRLALGRAGGEHDRQADEAEQTRQGKERGHRESEEGRLGGFSTNRRAP